MRNYQKSNYAINKYKEEIVYHFADGTSAEISLEDYLYENPDKSESDFLELKELSDSIYLEQDREETRYAKHRVSLGGLEETQEISVPSPYITIFQNLDEEHALQAARQLLKNGGLTEIQRRRFILHFFEGLSYRQIASQEEVNFAAVRDSIKWSIKKMKRLFDKF